MHQESSAELSRMEPSVPVLSASSETAGERSGSPPTGKPAENPPPDPPREDHSAAPSSQSRSSAAEPSAALETATLGGGCFWCLEAVFQQLRGVRKVTSGYSGGHVKNPTYEQVCTGTTGHAEVVQILFDPQVISYERLLEVFFAVHDPTTLNRQGNDVGPQYRSIIFYHNEQQRQTALRIQAQLDRSGRFTHPIVTQIVPFEAFYPAEDYHQNYFRRNPNQSYCRAVIAPKLQKFQKGFSQDLRPSSPPPSREKTP